MRQKGILIRHGPGPTKGSRGTVEKASITALEWTLAVNRSSSAYQRLAFTRGSANSRSPSRGATGTEYQRITGSPLSRFQRRLVLAREGAEPSGSIAGRSH